MCWWNVSTLPHNSCSWSVLLPKKIQWCWWRFVPHQASSKSCKIFDPLVLNTMILQSLDFLADDITYFGHDQMFTSTFIAKSKNEIPTLINDAQKTFDWSLVCNSNQFHTRSMKRIKRRRLCGDTSSDVDWKKYPGKKKVMFGSSGESGFTSQRILIYHFLQRQSE